MKLLGKTWMRILRDDENERYGTGEELEDERKEVEAINKK